MPAATHPFLINQTPFLAFGKGSSPAPRSPPSHHMSFDERTMSPSRATASRPSPNTHARNDSSSSLSSFVSVTSITSSCSTASSSSSASARWAPPRPRLNDVLTPEYLDDESPRLIRHAETEAILLGKGSRQKSLSSTERGLRRDMALAEKGYAMVVDIEAEKEAKRSRRMGMIF